MVVTIQVKMDCIKNMEEKILEKDMALTSNANFIEKQDRATTKLTAERDKAVADREISMDTGDQMTVDLDANEPTSSG